MSSDLMEYFNKRSRLGILSTSSTDERVDSAVFGSPNMIDEKTVLVATAKNRTFTNLLENPNAVYIIVERCSESPNETNTNMETAIPVLNKNTCGRRLNFLIFRNNFISLST
jgi:hypothetical protein